MAHILFEIIKQSAKQKALNYVEEKANDLVDRGIEYGKRKLINPEAESVGESPNQEKKHKQEHKPEPFKFGPPKDPKNILVEGNEFGHSTPKTTTQTKKEPVIDPNDDFITNLKEHRVFNEPKMAEQMETQIHAPTVQSGGGANGVGIRGKLTGNTMLNNKYAEYYEEINELHSRKVKNFDLFFGMASNPGTGVPNAAQGTTQAAFAFIPLPLTPGSANDAINFIPLPGQFAGDNNPTIIQEYIQRVTAPITDPDGNAERNPSWSDAVVAAPLNFVLDDFIDGKLLTSTGGNGLMTQYNRFRLLDFSVEVTLMPVNRNAESTWNVEKGLIANNYQVVNPAANLPPYDTQMVMREGDEHHLGCDFWVYRDFYNDYASSASPTIPRNWTTPFTTIDRRVRGLRNLDTYLTLLKPGEVFKFRREVNERASYYLTLAQLQALRDIPIQTFVALLEGLEGTNAVTPLPEGFNLLIAPTQCPLKISSRPWKKQTDADSTAKFYVIPGMSASAYCKFHATWKAFDFNYTNTQITRHLSEPEYTRLQEAIMRHNDLMREKKFSRHGDLSHYYNLLNKK